MKYRCPDNKKEERLAFGVWPTLSLAEIWAKCNEAKTLLVNGIDPKIERKEHNQQRSFEHVAREQYSKQKN